MKTRNPLIVTLLAIATLAILPGFAQAQKINHRLKHQNQRIDQGIKSGRLTRNQVKNLRSHDKNIHAREKWDRAHDNGHLTAGERHRLNRSLNRNSKHIYRDKHDAASHGA